jgi:hypothetical protein
MKIVIRLVYILKTDPISLADILEAALEGKYGIRSKILGYLYEPLKEEWYTKVESEF